jgi:hypothetical protein
MCQLDTNKEEKDVVRYCKSCYGLEPCLCDKHDYVKTWDFVYWTFKNCKM